METTVTSKGQLTLPQPIRHALGIDAGTVLEVELGAEGSVVLRKKATPGFFDQFVGLKARNAPFASGDEVHLLRGEIVLEGSGEIRLGRSREEVADSTIIFRRDRRSAYRP